MELRKRFNVRKFLIISYVLVFAIYIIYGLQPAKAAEAVQGYLRIDSIGLQTEVATASLDEKGLVTPENIPAIYSTNSQKSLIYGHSSTIFGALHLIKAGDAINYNGKDYLVSDVDVLEKNDVRMSRILSRESSDTIILMTCAGELYGNGDASHRLLVTAVEL